MTARRTPSSIGSSLRSGGNVGACIDSARAEGTEDDLTARGLNPKVARDEFVRFTLEGATVFSF